MELRLALVVRHVLQGVEQFLKIQLVAGVDAGIAGGVDAWRAAKGIDGQTGIVGDSRQAGDLRRMTRFQNRVFNEGQTGLFRRLDAELGLSDDIETKIFQQRGQFAHFAGVAGSEDDFLHDESCLFS